MKKLAGLLFAAFVLCYSSAAFSQTVCNDPSGFLKTDGPIVLGDVLVLGPDCQHAQDGGNISGPPSHPIAHPSSGNLVGSGCLVGEEHSLWWIDENLCSTADVWQITSLDPSALFTASVGGTPTVDDTLKLNFTFGAGVCATGTSPACDASIKTAGGDTIATLAAKMACAIANNVNLFRLNGATCSGGVVTPAVGQNYGGYISGSPIGFSVIFGTSSFAFDFNSNTAIKIVATVSGAATETITIGNTGCGVRCSFPLDNNPAIQMVRNSGAAPQPGSVMNSIYSIGSTSACPTSVCVNYGNISSYVANSTSGTLKSAWILQALGSGSFSNGGGGTWFGQGWFSNGGGAPFDNNAWQDKGPGTGNLGSCLYLNSTPNRDAVASSSICWSSNLMQISATGTDAITLSSSLGVGINTTATGSTFQSALGGFFSGGQFPTSNITGVAIGANGGGGYIISENFGTTTYQQLNLSSSLFVFAPNGIGNNGVQLQSNEFYPTIDNQVLLGDISTPHRFQAISTMALNLGGSSSGNQQLKAAAVASGTITLPAGTINFSATGGANQFVKQTSLGGIFTVAGITTADIPTAALTKTDDTNVTLTLGGSPSTALINAASLTLGWTGQLSYARGGTATNTSFTQGSIIFAGASSFSQDNSNLFWDGTNHRLGIGLTTPLAPFHISGTSNPSAYIDTYGDATRLIFRRAEGTFGSPTQVGANVIMGLFGSRAFNNSGAFNVGNTARLTAFTAEAQTLTTQGAYLTLETTPTGGTTLTEAVRIQASGGVSVGTTTDPGVGALLATDLYSNNATFLIRTKTALTNGAGAGAGTITNAPAAGNPTKWISIDDNGTTRRIPAW